MVQYPQQPPPHYLQRTHTAHYRIESLRKQHQRYLDASVGKVLQKVWVSDDDSSVKRGNGNIIELYGKHLIYTR